MTKYNLPDGLTEQKRFGRILDIIIDYADDEVDSLAEAILAETDAPAPPDADDNEAYDRWCEEVLSPVKDAIWNAALGALID